MKIRKSEVVKIIKEVIDEAGVKGIQEKTKFQKGKKVTAFGPAGEFPGIVIEIGKERGKNIYKVQYPDGDSEWHYENDLKLESSGSSLAEGSKNAAVHGYSGDVASPDWVTNWEENMPDDPAKALKYLDKIFHKAASGGWVPWHVKAEMYQKMDALKKELAGKPRPAK